MDKSYSAMEHNELKLLRDSKTKLLRETEREIKSLKKMFKTGNYDRQIICEHLLSYQRQRDGLTQAIGWITSKIAEKELSPAQS